MLATVAVGALAATLLSSTPDAVARGRRLFHDPGLGRNGVACADCHSTVADEAEEGDGRLRAGHSLWGAARRPHWRGDTRRTAFPRLGAALEVCATLFQGAEGLDAQDRQRLEAFIASLGRGRSEPPLQIQPALEASLRYDRPQYLGGDADRGRALFYRTCHGCHPHGGAGLGPSIRGLEVPKVALAVREGNGLLRGSRQPGAWAPFYGRDRLSDAMVADIAAFVSILTKDAEPDATEE